MKPQPNRDSRPSSAFSSEDFGVLSSKCRRRPTASIWLRFHTALSPFSFLLAPPKYTLFVTQFFYFDDESNPLRLSCGSQLPQFQLAYETYGTLCPDKSNAILLFHAMTGSQHAAGFCEGVPNLEVEWTDELKTGWWDGFIGPGKALDTDHFFIICANYLGGCYGSTGPTSRRENGQLWGADFPPVRVADIVDSQMRLLDSLEIEQLHGVVGASIGGLLSLSLATRYPHRVRKVVPMACGMETSILARILNFEQINAIESDPNFAGGRYAQNGAKPDAGLALARRIAHKTFVSLEDLIERASERGIVSGAPPFGWYEMNSPVESYMHWQGEKFVRRFDANSYLRILDAWQWFDLVREGRAETVEKLFARCADHEFLVFSIDSDLAFSPREQEKLVRALKEMKGRKRQNEVTWISVHSEKGHDSFLLEPKLYAPHLRALLLGE